MSKIKGVLRFVAANREAIMSKTLTVAATIAGICVASRLVGDEEETGDGEVIDVVESESTDETSEETVEE